MLRENTELKRRVARFESIEGVYERRMAERENERIKELG